MNRTPQRARIYLWLGAFLIALPTLLSFYGGHTGKVLVAMGKIKGEPFREKVLYVAEHNVFGAFGLILNRPLTFKQMQELGLDPEMKTPVHYGGPVDYPSSVYMLRKHEDGTLELISGDDEINVADLTKEIEDQQNIIVLFGYAGWRPLQLESEIRRGAWGVLEYDRDMILGQENMREVWRAAMKELVKKKPPKDDEIL